MPGRVDFDASASDARSEISDHHSVAHSAASTQGTTTASLSSRIAALAVDYRSLDLDDSKQASTCGSTHSGHHERNGAHSLAGFSEEAEGEGLHDGMSEDVPDSDHDGEDGGEEEEELVEMTEQELLRLLDAQEPSLQVFPLLKELQSPHHAPMKKTVVLVFGASN